jgi:hypothetical protein
LSIGSAGSVLSVGTAGAFRNVTTAAKLLACGAVVAAASDALRTTTHHAEDR